jgi:hypothetical protein
MQRSMYLLVPNSVRRHVGNSVRIGTYLSGPSIQTDCSSQGNKTKIESNHAPKGKTNKQEAESFRSGP